MCELTASGRLKTVEEAIGRLQEYRAALITEAVTGKVDVSTALNTGVRAAAGMGKRLEYPEPRSELMKAAENAGKEGAWRTR